jgi:hypothetical protein
LDVFKPGARLRRAGAPPLEPLAWGPSCPPARSPLAPPGAAPPAPATRLRPASPGPTRDAKVARPLPPTTLTSSPSLVAGDATTRCRLRRLVPGVALRGTALGVGAIGSSSSSLLAFSPSDDEGVGTSVVSWLMRSPVKRKCSALSHMVRAPPPPPPSRLGPRPLPTPTSTCRWTLECAILASSVCWQGCGRVGVTWASAVGCAPPALGLHPCTPHPFPPAPAPHSPWWSRVSPSPAVVRVPV